MPSIQSVLSSIIRGQPADPSAALPDLDVSSLISELDLKEVDFDKIQSGIVSVSVPLNTGAYTFPGKFKPARVLVKPHTVAWLNVRVGKNKNNESVLESVSIKISPKIKITNPSSAYEPSDGMNGFKDCLAVIGIEGIEIGSDGRILFQGKLKKGFASEDIQKSFKPEMFPVLDLRLNGMKDKLPAKKNPGNAELDLGSVLNQFSKMLGEAKCSAKVLFEAPKYLSLAANAGIKLGDSSSEVSLHWLTRIDSKGDFKIRTQKKYLSELQCFGITTALCGDVSISGVKALKPQVYAEVSAHATIPKHDIALELANRTTIPISVGEDSNFVRVSAIVAPERPVRVRASGELDIHVAQKPGIHFKRGSISVQDAHIHFDGTCVLERELQELNGHIIGRIVNPTFEYRSIHATIPGEAGVSIRINNPTQGSIAYHVQSERLERFQREVGYSLGKNRNLALTPYNPGLSEFLDPVNQFMLEPRSLSVAGCDSQMELSGETWRERAETIAGTPVLQHNRLSLLIDGKHSFPKRLELINNAQKSIYVQSLIFKDDRSGQAIAEALVAAKNRGVDVYVIIDSLGNLDSVRELVADRRLYEYLKTHGVRFELYSNAAVSGLRDILTVIEKHKILDRIIEPSDITEPKLGLSTLHMFARATGEALCLDLTPQERQQIYRGLRTILGNDAEADRIIDRLKSVSGIEPLQLREVVAIFKRTLSFNHRWHEKYLIADNQRAILGGLNIADEYLRGGMPEEIEVMGHSRPAWRDTDVLIEGEGAYEAAKCFAKNWKSVNGEELDIGEQPKYDPSWNTEVQVIQSTPLRGPAHTITNLRTEAINSLRAGDKAYEASAYFLPMGALREYCEALKLAAKRGVDVRILTNSIWTTDMPQVNKAAAVLVYRDLLKAGVRIFERSGTQTMHQKTAVYGSKMALIGSYNLDNRSASLNSEDEVVAYDTAMASQLESVLLADMGNDVAVEKTLEDFESAEPLEEIERSIWAMFCDLM